MVKKICYNSFGKRSIRGKVFLGEYLHSLDGKNRLRLPPKLKKDFVSSMVLTCGADGCIYVLPKEKFDSLFSSSLSAPIFNSKTQHPLRLLFSKAEEVQEDSQGRFLLPQSLKEHACIQKEVYFIGAGNRVEIWSKDRWEGYSKNLTFDKLSKELEKYGF